MLRIFGSSDLRIFEPLFTLSCFHVQGVLIFCGLGIRGFEYYKRHWEMRTPKKTTQDLAYNVWVRIFKGYILLGIARETYKGIYNFSTHFVQYCRGHISSHHRMSGLLRLLQTEPSQFLRNKCQGLNNFNYQFCSTKLKHL